MFSLLNKSKNYLLVEERCNILKDFNHLNNVLIFSPLNDIMFNRERNEDRFLYPNKYNVYFKLYNIFSMFARSLSFYLNNPEVQISSSLFFDIYKFSLRDFLKSLLGGDNHIFYRMGLGLCFDTYMNTHIYWSGNLSDTMIVINTNPKLYLNIPPSSKNFFLDFGGIIRNIHVDFNTFNVAIRELLCKSNKIGYNILTNIIYIKDVFLKYLSEEKFKDFNVYFHLSNEDCNSHISESYCYVKPDLVFFYDKYRKSFLFIYENVYSVENYYSQGSIRFYGNDLMRLKFYMIRVDGEIEIGILFEFYPDHTYDIIRFSIVDINGNSEEYTYKNNQDGKGYEKTFKCNLSEYEERFKKMYASHFELIDTVFDKISSESKFFILNNDVLEKVI